MPLQRTMCGKFQRVTGNRVKTALQLQTSLLIFIHTEKFNTLLCTWS